MATDQLRHRPANPPGWCSILGREAGEPLPGSAAVTRAWLVIEDPGPWGREALDESTIPGPVAASVARKAAARGARVQLVRNPDRSSLAAARRVLLADAAAGTLADLGVHDDDSLGELDLAAGAPVDEQPVFLVCTHAKRDACCAAFGRPLVGALATATDAAVWETSHTSGHRFAGVTVVLPWGLTYGRLAPDDVPALVAATNRAEVLLPHYRGRSSDPAPAQVADIAVRGRTATLGIDDVVAEVTDATDEQARVRVSARGVVHDVVVRATVLAGRRPPSCGREDEPVTAWQLQSVELLR